MGRVAVTQRETAYRSSPIVPSGRTMDSSEHYEAGARELVDVVNLVLQSVWANMRRSGREIEMTQWATLRRISRGPCTVGELARHRAVSLPTMSKSVDMLVRRGWVERSAGEADRRQTVVKLTRDGDQILAACRRDAEEYLAGRLEVLTPAERSSATFGLQLVRCALGTPDATLKPAPIPK